MHSMIIAEPIGILIGIVSGRIGANLGSDLAEEMGLPPTLGAVLGATIAHYVGSAITKAVINAAMLDIAGGTANVAVTSPTTSVIHGIVEGLSNMFPGVDPDTLMDYVEPQVAGSHRDLENIFGGVRFGSSVCHICGGARVVYWPSSGTPEECWQCGGTGVV